MIQKHTRNTPSHLSDFDSTNARRQEGSITIAFAKSISCALVQSISSVSRAINLQLWTWYHVTLRYYTLNTTWSCHIAAEVYIWRGILQAWRCSEKDCSGLEHLSCPRPMMSHCLLSSPWPQTQAGGQLVEAHWDHQQRHEQHKGLKGEDTPCNNTLRLPLHLVITSKVSIQAAGMITFVCLQGF